MLPPTNLNSTPSEEADRLYTLWYGRKHCQQPGAGDKLRRGSVPGARFQDRTAWVFGKEESSGHVNFSPVGSKRGLAMVCTVTEQA